ncbi:MAG: YegP family protein [Treponema sp.]|nr:YegP family protein [Treponema sp.]MCL2251283.1 YegP family protein [Treponema sp.]
MPAKFTVYKDKSGQFRFNLKAGNGEIIAVGEAYPDKKSCLKGIASIQKNAPVAEIVDSTIEAPKTAAAPKAKKPAASKAKKPAAAKPKKAAPKAKKPVSPPPAEG